MRLTILTILLVLAAAVPVLAQAPPPPPPPPPPSSGDAGSLREGLEELTTKATELLPELEENFETPYADYLVQLAWYLLWAVAFVGFFRTLRSGQGAGEDLFWWFGRLAICLSLILATNGVWAFASSIGRAIAIGGERPSWLQTVLRQQQASFNESYQKFVDGHFLVKTGPGGPDPVEPPPDGTIGGALGVIFSNPKPWESAELGGSEGIWMPYLFEALNACRGIMETADLFLVIIGYVVAMAMRLSAPFMVALAVDRAFALRASYNFAWGAVVVTVVLPPVAVIMRALAYMIGNLGMAVGDGAPRYRWDPATLSVVTSGVSPFFTVAFACVMMLIAALLIFGAPFIAYKLTTGQVFEAVSQQVSGWAGAILSTGVEAYSTAAAASINRQAESTQVHASAETGRVEATASRDAGRLRNDANYVRGKASAIGGATAGAGAIMASARSSADVTRIAGQTNAAVTTMIGSREVSDRGVDASATKRQQMFDTTRNWAVRAAEGEGRTDAAWGSAYGDVIGSAGVGKVSAGRASGAIGSAYSAAEQNEAAFASGAADERHLRSSHANVDIRTSGLNENSTNFATAAADLQVQSADRQAAAIMQGGREGAGAQWAGAGITIQGLETGKAIDNRALDVEYDARVSNIAVTETAGLEAAELRAKAQFVSQMGHSLARRVDEAADQMRY